ncbi:hypothetical protein BKG76_06040 [Mycobacteroides franklinii]|uniref:Uncharacterized protein n=1 Tax=Mycobacteroides franklinii TaxID=948102 RepID=A0A1S1LB40_9MYCO|nr:hypothetical protein BKG76_06040 [Mycobacteroides franklinii]
MTNCRKLAGSDVATEQLPQSDLETQSGADGGAARRLASFAAGGALVAGGVAALHNLYRSGDSAADLISWSALLLLTLTALGGGIKLATWGAQALITAILDNAKNRSSEPAQAFIATVGVIVGALGMWWVFRGGYGTWWQSVTGERGWSLLLGVGQMLIAVLASVTLFAGGTYLAGVVKESLVSSGLLAERDRARRSGDNEPSHPALMAALISGALGLVILAAWLTPKLAPTISGAGVLPATAAVVAVLVWAIGASLGWWTGLSGLWVWVEGANQKAAALAGVAAVLMFSAGGLGLGWFTPATVPQAHAACPPDCGGSPGDGAYGPDASQFQPPQMPNQMPDYQGSNSGTPSLDQNNGISIYNQQPGQGENTSIPNGSAQQGQNADGSWQRAANGEQIPDYQNASPYPQGQGSPNPDYSGGQANPGSQGVDQAPQQQEQGPQQSRQSDQSSDQQKQSTQDGQRIDDMTRQLKQQKQNKHQSSKFSSKDKKKDDQQDRDKQSGDNDLTALLLGVASTRRRKQGERTV